MAARTERCFHGPPRGLAHRPSGPGKSSLEEEASESPAPAVAVTPVFGHLRNLAQFIRVRVQMSSPKPNPQPCALRVEGVFDHRSLTRSRARPLSTSERRPSLDDNPLMSDPCPVVGGGLFRRDLTVREVRELLFPSSLSSSPSPLPSQIPFCCEKVHERRGRRSPDEKGVKREAPTQADYRKPR